MDSGKSTRIIFTCNASNSASQLSASVTNKVGTQTEADKVHGVIGCSSDGVDECQELSKATTNCWDSPDSGDVVGNGKPSPVQNNDVHVIFSKIRCRNKIHQLNIIIVKFLSGPREPIKEDTAWTSEGIGRVFSQ